MGRPKGSKNKIIGERLDNFVFGLKPEIKQDILYNKLMVDIFQTQKEYNISNDEVKLVIKSIINII